MCLPSESWSVCGSPVIYMREGEKRVWCDWESMKWIGKWWRQSITFRLLTVLGITSDCKTSQLRKVQWRLLREVPRRSHALGARNSGKRHSWEQLPSECGPAPNSIISTWNTSEMNPRNPYPRLTEPEPLERAVVGALQKLASPCPPKNADTGCSEDKEIDCLIILITLVADNKKLIQVK